jgi:hypothetical protein
MDEETHSWRGRQRRSRCAERCPTNGRRNGVNLTSLLITCVWCNGAPQPGDLKGGGLTRRLFVESTRPAMDGSTQRQGWSQLWQFSEEGKHAGNPVSPRRSKVLRRMATGEREVSLGRAAVGCGLQSPRTSTEHQPLRPKKLDGRRCSAPDE